jgi:WD repeat-containing protein 1 (actin-interacting protein 1)
MVVGIWAASPSTQRARPVHLSADSNGRLAYASNKSVYIRDIAHPFENTRQFNGHRGFKTTVAKFSPNGNYIASGGLPVMKMERLM